MPDEISPSPSDLPTEEAEGSLEVEEEPSSSTEVVGLPPPPPFPVPPLFGKYEFSGVVVQDPSLRRYLNLNPVFVLHTGARHANRPFGKPKVNVVERLVNVLMKTENWTGKKLSSLRVVREAFDIIHVKTGENPIQVLVRAIENAAPREEVTRLKYGGISVPKAVDVSPSRRLDVALRNLATGAVNASHGRRPSMAECLAEEILKAAKNDQGSYAISKKEEVERVAKSAR